MVPKELFFKYVDMGWDTDSEVCVGEDVKLIIDCGELNPEEIKSKTEFRILNFNNELMAAFPLIDTDGNMVSDWEISQNTLTGKLNLNTTELVNMFKGFGSMPINLPFIATLDLLQDGKKTSLFNTQIKLKHWQRITMPEGTVSVYSYKTYLEHLIEEYKEYLEGKIDDHVNDKSNPHEVTPEQIGAATKNYVDEGLTYQASVLKKDISDAVSVVDKKIEDNKEDVSEEISRLDNLYFTAKEEAAELKGEIDSLAESVKNIFYWKGTVDVLPKKWDGDPEEIPEGYVLDLKQGDVYRLSSDGVEYFYIQPDDDNVEGHWEPLGFDPIEGLKNSVAFKGVLLNEGELDTIADPAPKHGDMYFLKKEKSIAIYNTRFFPESEGEEREPGWLITQGDVMTGDAYFSLILEPLKEFLGEYEGFVKPDALVTLLQNQRGVQIGTDYWNSIPEEYTNEDLKTLVGEMPNSIKIGSGNPQQVQEAGIAIGGGSSASYGSVAIGYPAEVRGQNSIAIGLESVVGDDATDNGIAIGHGAEVHAANAVQIGEGENHTANSLQFRDKVIADLNGKTFLLPSMPAISIGGTSETDSIDGTEEKEEAMIAIGSDATASGSSSIAIGGTYKIENGDDFDPEKDVFDNTSVVGFGSTAIGQSVKVEGNCSTAVGFGNSLKCNNSVALGKHLSSESDYTVLIGDESELGEESSCSIVIGSEIESNGFENVVVGYQAKALGHCTTAIGTHAKAMTTNSVQLGEGENTNEGSLQFRGYPIVDKDGKIYPGRISIEQIGALPTVDGVAENLKKKNVTDTKTASFSWGTGSHGTIKAVFDEYGNLNDGLFVDIGGNWVRNPQENLTMYYYGSVSGLREDLTWYNVSCSDYVYPDENASEDNYNYAYNFYLGYDESNGIFVEVAFEMSVYNEETGESGYECIVKPCHSTPWEDVIINSPVLSEYELLDDDGKIKSEKIPPYNFTESDPKFNSWKNGTSIAAGSSVSGGYYNSIAVGSSASVGNINSIAVGSSANASGHSCIALGEKTKSENFCSIAIGGVAEATTKNCIAIGYMTKATAEFSTALGSSAEATAEKSTAIGDKAKVTAAGAIQLGEGTNETENTLQFRNLIIADDTKLLPKMKSIVLGETSTTVANNGVTIGCLAKSSYYGIAIGTEANSTGGRQANAIAIGYGSRSYNSIAIGYKAGTDDGLTPIQGVAIGLQSNIKDSKYSIAVGYQAKIALSSDTSDGVAITNAVQLGTGTNSKSNSLQFLDTTLFENGKLNLDTIVLNDSVANEDGTVNKYKLKVTNGVLGVELITEEATA